MELVEKINQFQRVPVLDQVLNFIQCQFLPITSVNPELYARLNSTLFQAWTYSSMGKLHIQWLHMAMGGEMKKTCLQCPGKRLRLFKDTGQACWPTITTTRVMIDAERLLDH